MKNHTLSILVTNEAGVLSRIVDLFSGRGFNIESLTVAPTLDRAFSRVTIVTPGDDAVIEQILKQLNRLIPVLKVMDLKLSEAIEVEIGLIKVYAKDEDRNYIMQSVDSVGASIIDFTEKTYTIQIIGDENKIKTLVELLRPIGIKEFVRSGKTAISRDTTF